MNIFLENCLKSTRNKKVFFFSHFFHFWGTVLRTFAPTSRSRMFNIFRDSESLGKSIWKKWSQIWTFLFENCLKSPRKKKVFFSHFFSLLRYRLTVFLPPLPEVGCPIFLEIQNPWGKEIKRRSLRFKNFILGINADFYEPKKKLIQSAIAMKFFSKHRPSGPMLSISRNVRLCVCLCVCLSVCSLLRYRLTVF
jgi:hypothetical protein